MANADQSSPSPDDYRVSVLGPLTVSASGAESDLGGPKQRLVLALLVARIGDVVSTGALIDRLARRRHLGRCPPVRAAGSNLDAEEWGQWGPRDTERYAICAEYPL